VSLACTAEWPNIGPSTKVAIRRFRCVPRFYANHAEECAATLTVRLVVKYDLFSVYYSVGVTATAVTGPFICAIWIPRGQSWNSDILLKGFPDWFARQFGDPSGDPSQ